MIADNDTLIRRALSAYIASGDGALDCLPDREVHTAREIDHNTKKTVTRRYVHLHNGTGTLAVYRVRTDGMLKRLRRWSPDLFKRKQRRG